MTTNQINLKELKVYDGLINNNNTSNEQLWENSIIDRFSDNQTQLYSFNDNTEEANTIVYVTKDSYADYLNSIGDNENPDTLEECMEETSELLKDSAINYTAEYLTTNNISHKKLEATLIKVYQDYDCDDVDNEFKTIYRVTYS